MTATKTKLSNADKAALKNLLTLKQPVQVYGGRGGVKMGDGSLVSLKLETKESFSVHLGTVINDFSDIESDIETEKLSYEVSFKSDDGEDGLELCLTAEELLKLKSYLLKNFRNSLKALCINYNKKRAIFFATNSKEILYYEFGEREECGGEKDLNNAYGGEDLKNILGLIKKLKIKGMFTVSVSKDFMTLTSEDGSLMVSLRNINRAPCADQVIAIARNAANRQTVTLNSGDFLAIARKAKKSKIEVVKITIGKSLRVETLEGVAIREVAIKGGRKEKVVLYFYIEVLENTLSKFDKMEIELGFSNSKAMLTIETVENIGCKAVFMPCSLER